jgi:TM2 domain-containing membrane protein YozV
MKRTLLCLAGSLLVLLPNHNTIRAQDRQSIPDLRSLQVASRTVMNDSLAPLPSAERPVNDLDELKNPRLAGAFSVLVPGLGQIYNGELLKGAVIMAGFLGGIAVCITADIGDTNDEIGTLGWFGVGMVGTSYLWGVIDAPLSANRINQQNASRGMPSLLEIHAGAYSISFKAGVAPHGISACVRLGVL